MTAYYNEIESFPCQVIRANMERGRLAEGKIDQRDIRNVTPDDLVGYKQIHLFAGIGVAAYACHLAGITADSEFSLLTAGFPCKNLAAPGDGTGIGTRDTPTRHSGLFWPMLDIIAYVRPDWLLIENSPALRTRGIDTVLYELEMLDYTCWPTVVGAWATGAPHERNRVWIVAHSERIRRKARRGITGNQSGAKCGRIESNQHGSFVANTNGQRHSRDASNEIQSGRNASFTGSASSVGVGQADADATGRRERRGAIAVEAEQPAIECGSHSERQWPVRPGEVQHAGEAQRLVLGQRLWNHGQKLWPHFATQLGECAPASKEPSHARIERKMGGAAHGPAERLAGNPSPARRDSLKALGNAWVVQCAVPILKWIAEFDRAYSTTGETQ
jgi:DNA (cytosine-5)-methyltransferase 1